MFKYFLYTAIVVNACTSLYAESDLDRIISPEIKNDAFYQAIYRLAKNEQIRTILEIGSSSGDGSTEAFVLGMSENQYRPVLFCMEVSKPRFMALKERYKYLPYVKCYNVSSVPVGQFPSENEIISFLKTTPTNLNMYGCECVLGWLRQDIAYVMDAQVPQHGIEIIKTENNIEYFDVVLIDGSEFTGKAEFALVYGARFILLDDINAFKNYANYKTLLHDPNYELIEQNLQLRNGYAIFKRKN